MNLEKKHKILIIDDEEDVREIVKYYIEEEITATVVSRENGETGLESAFHEEFDIIFCDFKMPQLDGVGFLERIRSLDNPNFRTNVIFLSGAMPKIGGDPEIWRDLYFIDKPFTQEKISYHLKLLLNNSD